MIRKICSLWNLYIARLAYDSREKPSPLPESWHAVDESRRMWRRVWRLLVKPKLKHFLWKCLHNWIATGCALQKRGMEIDKICRRCGAHQQTREHLFFHCHSPNWFGNLLLSVGMAFNISQIPLRNGGSKSVWLQRTALSKNVLNFQSIYYGTYGKRDVLGNLRDKDGKFRTLFKELCMIGVSLRRWGVQGLNRLIVQHGGPRWTWVGVWSFTKLPNSMLLPSFKVITTK